MKKEINNAGQIVRNAVGCLLCGEVVESKDRLEYCRCGNVGVDGGREYLIRYIFHDGMVPFHIELSQYKQ